MDTDMVVQLVWVAVMTALRLLGVCCCRDRCCRNHGKKDDRGRS